MINEQPSTGYTWMLDEGSLREKLKVEEEYAPYASQTGMLGAPGTKIFTVTVPENA